MTLSNLPAPFAPLVSGGEGLEFYPTEPKALIARLSEIYAQPVERILPVRGVTHGLELIFRLAARDGEQVEAPDTEPYRTLAGLYAAPRSDAATLAVVLRGHGSTGAVVEMAARVAPALLVVDEGLAEFSDADSAIVALSNTPNLIVLRSLSLAYGLAGARVGACIAQPAVLARLASVLEPYALPEMSVRLALQALDPSRLIETQARIAAVQSERDRLMKALSGEMTLEPGAGPILMARPIDPEATAAALARFGVSAQRSGDRLRLPVSARADINDRLLAALGLARAPGRARRIGEAIRDTKETRIVCTVDLDVPGPVEVRTGVGFFDHMLEQVAAHGGFSLRLACQGDLHIDPHHTVEDCAIALGQALRQALGERRGIARYGFVLPMDEANATVSIDLSGRPYPVFEGAFQTAFIGDYRTDLTAHVFRSLAEHLGAAIHVSVKGEDDHHKTEAVYKAFGRALRQAIRVEGDAVPSTKGRIVKTVAVLAYGAGNLASVSFALERLGANVRLTADPTEIAEAERLILPGVGAARYAMTKLAELGLIESIRGFQRPMLGVCLGQQLLFDASDEGDVQMLGLIPGHVRRMEPSPLPSPHMGWSKLAIVRTDPLLDGVGDDDWAYFVHGYVCPDGPTTLARAEYGGPVPAVVRRDNRWGCQFHPERSAQTGARVLRNFLELPA